MIQEIIILIVFLASAFYIGRLLYSIFTAKSGCVKGCGSACSAIDFNKIQQQLDQKSQVNK